MKIKFEEFTNERHLRATTRASIAKVPSPPCPKPGDEPHLGYDSPRPLMNLVQQYQTYPMSFQTFLMAAEKAFQRREMGEARPLFASDIKKLRRCPRFRTLLWRCRRFFVWHIEGVRSRCHGRRGRGCGIRRRCCRSRAPTVCVQTEREDETPGEASSLESRRRVVPKVQDPHSYVIPIHSRNRVKTGRVQGAFSERQKREFE